MARNPSRHPPLRAVLAIAVVPLLVGCFTEALWSWYDPERVPDLEASTHELEVTEVRAPGGELDSRLAVAVRPAAPGRAPAHVQRLARSPAAWMQLSRRPDVAAARGGVVRTLEPSTFELDVFDGEHLHRSMFNARVRVHGEVDRAELGDEVSVAAVPGGASRRSLESDNVMAGGILGRILEGFDAHPWLALLADDPSDTEGEGEPIAFVGPSGETVDPLEMLKSILGVTSEGPLPPAEACHLVGRYETVGGRTRFVSIPVPLLLEASEMTFSRSGESVAFTHDQAWEGRFETRPIAILWPDADVPLLTPTVSYRWSDELSNERPILYALSTLLTPITAVTDFVLRSNAAIANLLEELARAFFDPLMPRRKPSNR